MKQLLQEAAVIRDLFRSPQRAIDTITTEGRWWRPLVFLFLVSLLFATQTSRITHREILEAVSRLPVPEIQKDDLLRQLQQEEETGITFQGIVVLAGSLLLNRVLLTTVMLFTANVIFLGHLRFAQLFLFSAYGGYFTALDTLLRLPLVLARESTNVFLSPGLLWNPPQGFTQNFFMHLDLLILGEMVFLGLVLSRLLPTDRWRPAITLAGMTIIWFMLSGLAGSRLL